MLYAPNNNTQMVKNIHRCAKYYLQGTQTEEIPDIPYFFAREPVAEIPFWDGTNWSKQKSYSSLLCKAL